MLFHDLHSDIDRHTAEHALKLQQKMLIVGDLMKDVAQTVHTQGETLDRIDIEVDKGKVFTGKATAELEKTDESQRRKKKCCWFILSVSFGAVIALIIVVVMITKN